MAWSRITTVAASAGLAVCLSLALGGCSESGPVAAPESRARAVDASRSLEKRSLTAAQKYEIKFMQNMIDHHAMAVMMAEMCQERAVHMDLEEMCLEIEATQSAEIEQMQAWLQRWYGISYTPEMSTDGGMGKLMEATGEEFEIMFMEMMIKHHEKAVKEGAKCMERAVHEELIEMCHHMVQAQAAEIEQMETWLCAWYDECG